MATMKDSNSNPICKPARIAVSLHWALFVCATIFIVTCVYQLVPLSLNNVHYYTYTPVSRACGIAYISDINVGSEKYSRCPQMNLILTAIASVIVAIGEALASTILFDATKEEDTIIARRGAQWSLWLQITLLILTTIITGYWNLFVILTVNVTIRAVAMIIVIKFIVKLATQTDDYNPFRYGVRLS